MAELCIGLADFGPEAVRLASITNDVDGFGSGGGQRGPVGSVADPVARMVFAEAGGKSRECGDELPEGTDDTPDVWSLNSDRTSKLIENLFRLHAEMYRAAMDLAGVQRLIVNRGDSRFGRQTTVVDCLACDATITGVGEDRVKAGYCPTCHRAWLRWRLAQQEAGKDPVHESFRKARRAQLAAEIERVS